MLSPPTARAFEAARRRLEGVALRTPLIRLDGAPAAAEIFLKLENLQPIGSFKLRPAANAMLEATRVPREGFSTASAGNMGQGVAWVARQQGAACRVLVPEGAPATKREALERLGASLVEVPFERWWRALEEHGDPALGGRFIHPVSDPLVLAGDGTVGLEILEDLPDVERVYVPFGGGGLSCGIAAALRIHAPSVAVLACEVATASPLAAALAAGGPVEIRRQRSFVDGIGAASLLRDMWPLASELLAGTRVASPRAIAAAVRLLVERCRVVAEGAGAASVAAALADGERAGRAVCVISGGNIDLPVLAEILDGGLPAAGPA